jgi:hypothetical protein
MDELQILQDLDGETCLCGEKKERGNSFCRPHYYKLPTHKRRALYRRVGRGYEQAFEDAAKILGIWPEAPTPEPQEQRLAA